MGRVTLGVLLISMTIFSMMFIGFSSNLVEISDNYGVSRDANFSSTYDLINNLSGTVSSTVQDQEDDLETDALTTAGGDSIVASSFWSVIRLPLNLLPAISGVITAISVKIGLPAWAVGGLLAIAFIVVMIAILRPMFRYDL